MMNDLRSALVHLIAAEDDAINALNAELQRRVQFREELARRAESVSDQRGALERRGSDLARSNGQPSLMVAVAEVVGASDEALSTSEVVRRLHGAGYQFRGKTSADTLVRVALLRGATRGRWISFKKGSRVLFRREEDASEARRA